MPRGTAHLVRVYECGDVCNRRNRVRKNDAATSLFISAQEFLAVPAKRPGIRTIVKVPADTAAISGILVGAGLRPRREHLPSC